MVVLGLVVVTVWQMERMAFDLVLGNGRVWNTEVRLVQLEWLGVGVFCRRSNCEIP